MTKFIPTKWFLIATSGEFKVVSGQSSPLLSGSLKNIFDMKTRLDMKYFKVHVLYDKQTIQTFVPLKNVFPTDNLLIPASVCPVLSGFGSSQS